MAIALLAGFTVGLSPNASAHKKTNTQALVTGDVGWPLLPKEGLVSALPDFSDPEVEGTTCLDTDTAEDGRCEFAGFDLRRGVGPLAGGLTLDVRASDSGHARAGAPLNGCRLEGGNTEIGLRVVGDSHDLCFAFKGLEITAAGLWGGRNHATEFDCDASGTSTASGTSKPGPDDPNFDPTNEPPGVTLGAFYGEFTCDGDEVIPGMRFVPSADGHFHGLTLGSTTIGFLGEIHCREDLGDDCPKPKKPKPTPPGKDVNESRVKHTVACKGEVLPAGKLFDKFNKFPDPEDDPTPPNAVTKATVVLECVIA